jgi:hypothetical protein
LSTAEQQLGEFIARFSPEHQRLIRAVRKAIRGLLPTATSWPTTTTTSS